MINLLSLIVFLLPSYLIKFTIFGIPTTLLEILLYATTIYFIYDYFFIKQQSFSSAVKFLSKYKMWLLAIGLFVISGIIATVVSPNKLVALGVFKAYLIDPVIFFGLIIFNVKTQRDIDKLINALVLSGVVLSLVAVYQRITGDLTTDGRALSIYSYWEGASANYLALYLSPILVLLLGWQLLRDKDNKLKYPVLYDLAFLIIVFGLYLTGSRAGTAAALSGIIVLLLYRFWYYIKTRLWLKIIIYIVLIFGLIFSYQSIKPNYSLNELEGGRTVTSNNIRWEIYETTTEIIKNEWFFGTGLGNYQQYFTNLTQFRVNYPEYISPNAVTPHNLFLTMWVNLGILGLIAFIWLLVLFFREGLKHNHFTAILLITMISILAYGLLDTPYWKNDLAMVFWLILALSTITVSGSNKIKVEK